MRILLTARGPKLARHIIQLARDIGRGHDVAVVAYNPYMLQMLREAGILSYSPRALALSSRRATQAIERQLAREHPEKAVYLGLPLWELVHAERVRSRVEGRSGTSGPFIRRALEAVLGAQAILDDFQPDIVAVWNGNIVEARAFRELALRAGAGVQFLERGLLPGSLVVDPRGVNAESFLCSGNAWDELASASWEETVLQRAGAYVEQRMRTGQSVVAQPDMMPPDELRTRLEIPEDSTIILVPAQIDWDTNIVYNSPEFPTNADVLREVLAVANQRTGTFVVFKRHPEEPANRDYRGVLGEKGRAAEGINLHSLIGASAAVVVRNSTVGLEAVAHGKPVVVLGRALWSHKGFTYDSSGREQAREAVRTALTGGFTEEMRARAAKFFAYLLHDYLYFLEGQGAFPEGNRRVLKRMLGGASAESPRYGRDAVLRQYLPSARAQVERLCAEVGRQREMLLALRASPANRALVVRACDPDVFEAAGRALVKSGIARSFTILASDSRAPEPVVTSVLGGLREFLLARLGCYGVVVIVCNHSDKLSTKALWMVRALKGARVLVLEAGLAASMLPNGG